MKPVVFPSGAKARVIFGAVFGTTEVVPCYKSDRAMRSYEMPPEKLVRYKRRRA